MSFTEFSYQLLQAYDFLSLFRTEGEHSVQVLLERVGNWTLNFFKPICCVQTIGCKLQFGGSDQWGNITGGCDLVRKLEGQEAYGLTLPLLTTPSGEKLGKVPFVYQ